MTCSKLIFKVLYYKMKHLLSLNACKAPPSSRLLSVGYVASRSAIESASIRFVVKQKILMKVQSTWKEELQNLTCGYDSNYIYNADVTGLFFPVRLNKTLYLRGEKCVGGKILRERLTVLVCGNVEICLMIWRSRWS